MIPLHVNVGELIFITPMLAVSTCQGQVSNTNNV